MTVLYAIIIGTCLGIIIEILVDISAKNNMCANENKNIGIPMGIMVAWILIYLNCLN